VIVQGVYKRILDGIPGTALNDTPRRATQAWDLLNG